MMNPFGGGGFKEGKVFIEKMYLPLDQDDPQGPSLLAFQVHPVKKKSQ